MGQQEFLLFSEYNPNITSRGNYNKPYNLISEIKYSFDSNNNLYTETYKCDFTFLENECTANYSFGYDLSINVLEKYVFDNNKIINYSGTRGDTRLVTYNYDLHNKLEEFNFRQVGYNSSYLYKIIYENGNIIKTETFNNNVLAQERSYTYDVNNKISEIKFIIDVDRPGYINIQSFEYINNLLSEFNDQTFEGGILRWSTKYNYEYFSNDKINSITTTNTSINSDSINSTKKKKEYYYNLDGNKSIELIFEYLENDWSLISKNQYTYEDTIQLNEINLPGSISYSTLPFERYALSTFGIYTSLIPNYERGIYSKPLKSITFYNYEDEIWVETEKTEYNYSLNNNLIWNGSESSDWGNANNWSTVSLPTTTSLITIPSGMPNQPLIGTNTAAVGYDLTINEGATLNIESGGSLIINGTSSGNVTYNRALTFTPGNLEGWHLVSSPVAGQTYNDDFVNSNNIAFGTGTKRGIATYNNTVTSDNWSYFSAGGSGTFTSGIGYSIKRGTNAGNISFTGRLNTDDISTAITKGSTGFNLVGNPYTSYLNSTNVLTTNTNILDSETIWVWNPSTKNYEAKVTGDAFQVAPVQGFFVKTASTGNLEIAENTQSHQIDTFLKSAGSPEIILHLSDGALSRFAKVRFQENSSLAFDNGYDGESFSGIANKLDIYTHLLENNSGKKYQIQSLPNSELETMIIPVGISSETAKEITFTAESLNLPTEYKVFLEDRLKNVITRLDHVDANYKARVDSGYTDGRFYIYTRTSKILSSDSEILNSLKIYVSNKNLKVIGLQKRKASIYLYTILGKEVFNTSIQGASENKISLPKLESGIYFVKLHSEIGSINKKFILE